MTITNNETGTNVHEIADGIYRISTSVPPAVIPGGFTFNQILIVDDSPLLFHIRVEENPMTPGEDKEAILGPHLDLLVHRLLGVDPAATSARFSLRVVETGHVLMELDHVPVDAESGAVLLLCHKHYAAMPPNIVAAVRTRDANGRETLSEYTIRHQFLPE